MLDLFLENSLGLVVFCAPLLAIVFASSKIFNMPRLIYWGIGGTVALVGLVVFERLWVTDREYLKQTIYHMSDCVQRNDIDGLLEFVSPEAGNTYRRVQKELPDYQFRSCTVLHLNDLQIDRGQNPPQAKLDFSVLVDVDATIRYGYDGRAQRNVTLTYQKQTDGVWRVVGFEHYDPRDMIRRF